MVVWPGAPELAFVDASGDWVNRTAGADWVNRTAGADRSSGDGASPCWFCVLAVRFSANR